ncbi:DHH phosphoesterase [Pilatotrama ljubarskyi]|nr:DHH phosphoesterase [Pilatotrama ljubarskyi]
MPMPESLKSGSSRSSVSTPETEREWPAPVEQISAARAFLHECAASDAPTLLLPDKDADGLCSGLIVYHTLVHLGLTPNNLTVHFPAKGTNIHAPAERAAMSRYGARFVIVTDQGSRGGPPLVDDPAAKTLILDHHWSTEFPQGAVVCSAAQCEPVATSATLAYDVCMPLLDADAEQGSDRRRDDALRRRLDYLCAMGTMGDLGTGFKWAPPFPDMRDCLKEWTKKVLGEAIGLVNAPRRSAEYDVATAWRALMHAASPRDLVEPASRSADVRRLFAARAQVKAEVDRCVRRPPTFSGDGRVALVRVSSPAQVHPLIATRWASSLKGARLEIVMCANDSYSPGMTNFACRVARSGRPRAGTKRKETTEDGGEGETDIIATLQEYAGRAPGLREAMGNDFARGHREASGGIVRTADFERLWEVMLHAEREDGNPEAPSKRRKTVQTQKNTLEGWLKKS